MEKEIPVVFAGSSLSKGAEELFLFQGGDFLFLVIILTQVGAETKAMAAPASPVPLFLADLKGSGEMSCKLPTPPCPAEAGTAPWQIRTTSRTQKSWRRNTLSLRAEWTTRRELSFPTSGRSLCTALISTAVTTRLRSWAAVPPTSSLQEPCLQVRCDPARSTPSPGEKVVCYRHGISLVSALLRNGWGLILGAQQPRE